jgi:integrating conjugative element membrane protein (TIGR03745 family)
MSRPTDFVTDPLTDSLIASPTAGPGARPGLLARARTLARAVSARCLAGPLFVAGTLAASLAHAALPAPPQGLPTSGNYLENIRDYIGLAIGLLVLALCAFAFVAVASSVISKFLEWRTGRAEVADLKMTVVMGGLVLIIVVYLSTEAAGVIATSGTFAGA